MMSQEGWGSNYPRRENFFNLLGFFEKKKSETPYLNFTFHTKKFQKSPSQKISGYAPVMSPKVMVEVQDEKKINQIIK